jgi:hypothetical protein
MFVTAAETVLRGFELPAQEGHEFVRGAEAQFRPAIDFFDRPFELFP